jgi:hypothetical protein
VLAQTACNVTRIVNVGRLTGLRRGISCSRQPDAQHFDLAARCLRGLEPQRW